MATFTEERWSELGHLTGTIDIINGHHRLLRSLQWGDNDYGGHVFDVLPAILGQRFERLRQVQDYLGLRAWLADNEPGLAATLYGGTLTPQPLDLAALADPAVIRQHLDP